MDNAKCINGIDWYEITPDINNNWLTACLETDFIENCLIIDLFLDKSNGVNSGRDYWVYNFFKKLI
jgi:predicted helicase